MNLTKTRTEHPPATVGGWLARCAANGGSEKLLTSSDIGRSMGRVVEACAYFKQTFHFGNDTGQSMKAASVTPSKAKAADSIDTADDLDFVPPSLQKMRDLSSALKSQIEVQSASPVVVAGAGKKAPISSKQSGGLARKGASKAEEHADVHAAAEGSLPALELQIKVESLQSNIEKMQLDAKKKQDSYLRREAQYKGQIERMKQVGLAALRFQIVLAQ